ncbi:hypothetical protein ES703_67455 [subsurface metagenome]
MKEITVTTNDLMSVQDAAKALNRHRYQIYRWIDAGKIISIKLGGIMFIPVTEVERLKKERKEQAAEA